ncbi:MAG: beta-ketoacyl synthase chain length factor [Candidatus Thiodiazotropha sp. (ex Monitilora ramsayi)]|nr:beta-ketoacyl synthase chain length factor [Candidatus Thiodiazotropha sp. (ex Monitilora ramsayi)]
MIRVAIHAVGLMAPGLPGWRESVAVLQGMTPYRQEPLPPLKPAMLKPNERRRTTNTIKLALEVSADALDQVPMQDELLSVFASTHGDLDIINQICTALTQDERPVSPTQFHNSVHNAPAGYWSIAAGYQQTSTSLAGSDGTFSAGLLDAATQTVIENKPVLLVAYDLPAPAPLNEVITIDSTFAVSLLISNQVEGKDNLGIIDIETQPDLLESKMQHAQMEAQRLASPAARSLPLLEALAARNKTILNLPYLPDLNLKVGLAQC